MSEQTKALRRSEMTQFATAMRNRWEINPEYKTAMIRRLVQIIANPNSTPREVTSASRALIAAEGQNQQDEPISQQRAASIADLIERVRTIDCIEAVSGQREGTDTEPPESLDGEIQGGEIEYPTG